MTSPVSIPAGHELVAADFDAYENLTAAWASYSPTWASSGTQPAIGNGLILGSYKESGNFLVALVRIIMGSTTTFGTGTYTVSLPVANTGSFVGAGAAHINDSGTGTRSATCTFSTSTSVRISSDTAAVGATSPITFASGDEIAIGIVYEGV